MNEDDDNLDFAEYRLKPSYFYMMCVYTLIFSIIGTASVFTAMTNIDGSFRRPIFAATFLGIFWSVCFFAGLYHTIGFSHEQLTLSEESFCRKKLFRSRKYDLLKVTSLKWRIDSIGGSIVVESNQKKIRIDLSDFSKEDRTEIIDYFRSSVPEEFQTGWEESQEKIERAKSRPSEFTWQFYLRMAILLFIGSITAFYLRSYDIKMDMSLLVIGVGCTLLGIVSLAGSVFSFYKKKDNSQS